MEALTALAGKDKAYRLVIAGRPQTKNCGRYWERLARRISHTNLRSHVISRIECIPDQDTEIYFKAADVLILPYTYIFQSGVLFLAYNFGLPVIATDVGSFRDEIVQGRKGFLCLPKDPEALAAAIEAYFASDLYHSLAARRPEIRQSARERHSWEIVGSILRHVYSTLIRSNSETPPPQPR